MDACMTAHEDNTKISWKGLGFGKEVRDLFCVDG